MNIYDISKKSGVSIATVSRVLNNSPKVSSKTKARVLNVINETGFISREKSRKLSSKKIGILCTTLSHPTTCDFVDSLIKKFDSKGFTNLLYCTGSNSADKRQAIEQCISNQVLAIVIDGTEFLQYTPEANAYLVAISEKVPIFLVNAYIDAPNIYCILIDFAKSISSITESLIKKGRKNILFLFSSMSQRCLEMLDSYKAVCDNNKIAYAPDNMHLCTTAEVGSYIASLIQAQKNIDGIIASDDTLAAAAIKSVTDFGFAVPDDIEITGCGNTELSRIYTPSITTIDMRIDEISNYVLNSIISYAGNASISKKSIIPATIVVNQSTT